jgi:hypothetical protein
VIDADTVVGWVNAYFLDPVPVTWERLVLDDDFPTLPGEAAPYYAPAGDFVFVKDPSLCRTADALKCSSSRSSNSPVSA